MPHRSYPSALALLVIPAALVGAAVLFASRGPGPAAARQLAAASSATRAPASSSTATGRNGPAASLEGVFENLYD